MAVVDFFLTAFDPSDLPGTSIDPLGFDRGYTFLADKILPGLTNVASRPRYFGMLCAGIYLADVAQGELPKKAYQLRRQAVLRLERLWTLANVFAANEERSVSGIRGIRYVQEEVGQLQRKGAKTATPQFKLLSRQEPYGVLGIYGAIAEGLRLIAERKTFTLSPDAGDPLAEAFIEETAMPSAVKRAIRDDGEVNISTLTSWGERAHISAWPGKEEARYLREALDRNPLRKRTAMVLSAAKARNDEPELDRMRRMRMTIADDSINADIKDAVEAILAFEDCYRLTTLGFERLLWMCRNSSSAIVERSAIHRDKVIEVVCNTLPKVAQRLAGAFGNPRTDHLIKESDRIEDIRRFLGSAAAACDEPLMLCEALLERHIDVQHGKFDRGRRKMPWIESNATGMALTITRTGGLNYEVTRPEHISPHAYRLTTADAMLAASSAI